MLSEILRRIRDRIAAFDRKETEEFEAAGTPTDIRRWGRRSTALLMLITAVLGFVAVAIGLSLLFEQN